METQNHLLDGRDRGYLDAQLYSRLSNLARSALKTTTHLILAVAAKHLGNRNRQAPCRI